MQILTLVRSVLLNDAGVTAKRAGGVHINVAPEADAKPNVVLMLVSGVEELTHQGPDGLVHDRVRIWCRAKTAKEAGELGAAVKTALQGYQGTAYGMTVQLAHKVMGTSDYQDAAGIHRDIHDYAVHWGLS